MEYSGSEIAVVGMDIRIPGSNNINEFWVNLCDGNEGISDLSDAELMAVGVKADLLESESYVKRKSVCDNYDCFDASFFGYSEKDAKIMDPQQRIFLESCWKALENAGYIPNNMIGNTGVFGSAGFNTYLLKVISENPELLSDENYYSIFLGNDKDYLATRVSYKLGLTGPSVAVQTACSSSLASIHLACQSLLLYESDCCLAGGVNVLIPTDVGYKYQEGFIKSRDGRCRSFDNDSSGTIFGSGVGVVVLKRLEDAIRDKDTIYAIVRSTAINNDGKRKIGFTAPSQEGQQEVIKRAMELEDILAKSIAYIEAHGTGTTLGDPIELKSIINSCGLKDSDDNSKYSCAIGSVKSNIGHLDTASGVIGFIKTCLCVYHKTIVPTVHFNKLNSNISFSDTRFYIANKLEKITREYPIRAMVNALGIGGTNVCAILEEYKSEENNVYQQSQTYIIKVSAKSKKSLDNIEKYIISNIPIKAVGRYSYTLNCCRGDYKYRKIIILNKGRDDSYSIVNNSSYYELDFNSSDSPKNYWEKTRNDIIPFGEAFDYCLSNIKDVFNDYEAIMPFIVDTAWKMAINNVVVNSPTKNDVWQMEFLNKIVNKQTNLDILWNEILKKYDGWILDERYSTKSFLQEIGQSWLNGCEIYWSQLYNDNEKVRVAAPTYCFDKKRYWVTSNSEAKAYIWNEKIEKINILSKDDKDVFSGRIFVIGKDKQRISSLKDIISDRICNLNAVDCIELPKDTEEGLQNFESILESKISDDFDDLRLIFTDGLDTSENAYYDFYDTLMLCVKMQKIYSGNLDVIILNSAFNDSENIISGGMIYGIITSMPMEFNNLKMKQILFSEEGASANYNVWLDELLDTITYNQIIVDRSSKYFTNYVEEKNQICNIKFYDGANYVITGGTGNVGLLFANEICKRVKANIYLISNKYTEDKLIHESDEKSRVILHNIENMRKTALSVNILNFDLSKEKDYCELEDYFCNNGIKIDGIIHAAGKVGKAKDFVDSITLDKVKEYCDVKVRIAQKILMLNNKYSFGFCIFISSTVSMLGGLGDTIYSGCNAAINYMMKYSEYGKSNCLAIAFDYLPRIFPDEFLLENDTRYRGLYANQLSLEEFSYSFDYFVNHLNNIAIVSKADLNKRLDILQQRIGKVHNESSHLLCTKESIRIEVSNMWRETLGTDNNDNRNFFDAGGDSLLAINLVSKLSKCFKGNFTIKYVFEFPTISLMVEEIYNNLTDNSKNFNKTKSVYKDNEKISVIGMSGIFPGANSVDELWDNLLAKKNCMSYFESCEQNAVNAIPDKHFAKEIGIRGIIENVDKFDYEFFNIPKYEAKMMDPQQRKFLECAWIALEDAGCVVKDDKIKIGVFASQGISTYLINNLIKNNCLNRDYNNAILMNNSPDALATRVSYSLDLTGVSRTVQSFCSSSLNAVEDAIVNIKNGLCDVALVGGSNIVLPQKSGYIYNEGSIYSAGGKIYPFDDRAEGTIFSNGVGAVVIARNQLAKEKGCHIYANIIASNINNDGMQKVSYLSPGIKGQVECVSGAYERSEINPERVTYIEAHGTGTKMGDPIEVFSLSKAFEKFTDKKQFCAIGSIKANVGHLDRVAGIASLIKGCMIIDKHCIPPQAMYEVANKEIQFEETPFYVNTDVVMLDKADDIVVGVTALGVGGTNVHVVLENEKVESYEFNVRDTKKTYIFTFSANNSKSLICYMKKFSKYISKQNINAYDIETTLMLYRKEFNNRKAFTADNIDNLIQDINNYVEQVNKTEIINDKVNTIIFNISSQIEEVLKLCIRLKAMSKCFEDIYEEIIGSKGVEVISIKDLKKYIKECIKEVTEDYIVVLFSDYNNILYDEKTIIISLYDDEIIRDGKCKFIDIDSDLVFYRLFSLLWESGLDINWNKYKAGCNKKSIHLPGYVFKDTLCWIE